MLVRGVAVCSRGLLMYRVHDTHFGIHDASIPEAGARSFAAAQTSVETHFYDAGHGFNCDHRGQYDADAAALAWGRSMAFLETHLA